MQSSPQSQSRVICPQSGSCVLAGQTTREFDLMEKCCDSFVKLMLTYSSSATPAFSDSDLESFSATLFSHIGHKRRKYCAEHFLRLYKQ
jgi:hypothetical protein